jgi:Na+-translocating ferredoxin:NAD+ oxidoreductase RnfD subunit
MKRFFKTPKGILLLIFAALIVLAAPHEEWHRVMPQLHAAILAAGLVDLLILRYRHQRWEFPSGAILTAMIVTMVMSPFGPWWVPAVISAAAVASKYVLRYHAANIFNPAALGLVLAYYAFGSGESWWGALPELPLWGIAVLVAAGVFVADRVNKLPAVVAFLGAYYTLFTVMAFAGDPKPVAEIFRTPDLQTALYFAFFMLTDPPTAPTRYQDQIVFAALVAVSSFAIYQWLGVVYYLSAGLLIGNTWEAMRRYRGARVHRRPLKSAPTF